MAMVRVWWSGGNRMREREREFSMRDEREGESLDLRVVSDLVSVCFLISV